MTANETGSAEQFVEAFHDVFLALHRRRPASDTGLSPESWAVLEHLANAGPLTVTEAARHFGRSQSATSEIVQRLTRRGLLRPFADERDRRRTLVWLTKDGLKRWREERRVLDDQRVQAAMARLSSNRQRSLIAAMRALARAATEY